MNETYFDQLEILDTFSIEGREYTKLRGQTQGRYGHINAQGPSRYQGDTGYRYFYDAQVIDTPKTKEVETMSTPTRASIVKDGQAIIDAIEQLYADFEKVLPPIDDMARQRFNDASAVIDDVVTAMAHTDESKGDFIKRQRAKVAASKNANCPCDYPHTTCNLREKCDGKGEPRPEILAALLSN